MVKRKPLTLERKAFLWWGRYKWFWSTNKDAWRKCIKVGMAIPEVKAKLKVLNSRKRAAMTESHKTKISLALRGRLPPNMRYTNTYEHIQNGVYSINGREMYFRSKWEANVALYLDFLKNKGAIRDWHFESKWFEFPIAHGTTRYLPDFEVINLDGSVEYWEVKGYMDSRSKTKLRRMKKYHPNVKLIIIEGSFMKNLKQNFSRLLDLY